MSTEQAVRLSELYPPEYSEFWNTKAFYVACKGSKGSCKSTTTALWHIYMMMRYPEANTLVIRNVFGTIKDSCYTDLLWAIDTLGVTKFWKSSVNPLQLTYLPTGQVILFRGMDDALKIAGIKVRHGYLCWVWWEEFSDISNEGEFDKVMMSIRGKLPESSHLWKRCTMTFNPWSEHHFSKRRFFDVEKDNTLAMTTTYKCNRWLGEDDIARYDEMYISSPRQARIICDGDWGIADGLIYENWREERFDILEVMKTHPDLKFTYGLDFGFAVDPAAFVAVAVDIASNTIWIFDEIYEVGLDNMELAKRIVEMGYGKKTIVADSAEPKSIFELKRGFKEFALDDNGEQLYDETTGEAVFAVYQLPNIRSAFKGPDSLKNGIRRVQGFNIVVHPKCSNMMMEFNNYSWAKDKDGNYIDKPIDEFNHLADSLRYSLNILLSSGTSYITETSTEEPVMIAEEKPKRKCRRVFSTAD